MSNIHEQALEYVYTQVLDHLMGHMSQALRASMQLLIQRLMVAAGGVDCLGQFQLLVIHGADRDSALLLSTLRAAQLTIAQRAPQTFRLKVLVASLPAASVSPGAALNCTTLASVTATPADSVVLRLGR